jgi:hypothetical protein
VHDFISVARNVKSLGYVAAVVMPVGFLSQYPG